MRGLILAAALILSGCVYQTVDASDVEAARNLCRNHEGIGEITAIFSGAEIVYCKDGTIFNAAIYKPKECKEK